jgi:hypothetical protein
LVVKIFGGAGSGDGGEGPDEAHGGESLTLEFRHAIRVGLAQVPRLACY